MAVVAGDRAPIWTDSTTEEAFTIGTADTQNVSIPSGCVAVIISLTDITDEVYISPDSSDLDSGILLGGNSGVFWIYLMVSGHPTNLNINNISGSATPLVNVVRFFT